VGLVCYSIGLGLIACIIFHTISKITDLNVELKQRKLTDVISTHADVYFTQLCAGTVLKCHHINNVHATNLN